MHHRAQRHAVCDDDEYRMPRQRPRIYLRTFRRKAGLTQSELGALVGVSKKTISKYELEERKPSANLILACEIIFDARASAVFPFFCKAIQDVLGARALALHDRLQGRTDEYSRRKLAMLAELPLRTADIRDV
jgi:DNA-binding XRE family transcriptional regulator